jgi:hypothetical protein
MVDDLADNLDEVVASLHSEGYREVPYLPMTGKFYVEPSFCNVTDLLTYLNDEPPGYRAPEQDPA